VEVGESELDEDNLPQIEDIVSVCAGLVTIDEESGIIRLVHYTTQEYFQRMQTRWFPYAEKDITAICVTYISFEQFESGPCGSDEEFEQRQQSNPLYNYAAQNWGHHARQASGSTPEIIRFLKGNALVEASNQALNAIQPWPRFSKYSQVLPQQTTGIHIAAYFGVVEVVRELVGMGINIDSENKWGLTPLSYAAKNGHDAVVQRLLATGQVDADLKATGFFNLGRTPLSYAAENGHDTVVQRLLATGQVDTESEDTDGRTPLSYAAQNGHDTVVQGLLATGQVDADLKATGFFTDGRTQLIYAAENGHDAVVQHLLATGQVDADSKDKAGRTPLSLAARNGHYAVVKLLQA
jgi:ankyrin repeat protein